MLTIDIVQSVVELKRLKIKQNINLITTDKPIFNLAMFGWSIVSGERVFHRLTVEGENVPNHVVVGIAGQGSILLWVGISSVFT